MTEISVLRQKDRLSNNILLKVTAPLGAAWAVLTGSRELVKGSEVLSKIRDLLSATWVQPFLDQLLTYFIFGCVAIVLAYVFFWGPGLQRAQRLDDAVFVALRERVLNSSGTSKEANQITSVHDDGADA